MKLILTEKKELIESEPPREEYKTKDLYDLHGITRGKSLILYDLKERTQYAGRMNKTLLSLARMHCANEDITLSFLLEVVLIDFLKRNRIIKCRIIKKRRMLDPEKRQAHRKRMKQYHKALKEMRGLRHVITHAKPKRKNRKLQIDTMRNHRGDYNVSD